MSKVKILLVEDDVNFGMVMRDYLMMNGYDVVLCEDGNKGWTRFSNESFDLCILDVMMPEKDGFSLGRDIRKVNPRIPLIFLTARSMKSDMVKGFNLGADDYITKPFDTEILLLKLQALLKRSGGNVYTDEQIEFNIGEYLFNYRNRELVLGKEIQKLSPRESELLKLLCLHKNTVLSREVALKTIWNEDNYFTGRSMDVFITKIRKYLRGDPTVEILNIHGNGFRMVVND